MKHILCLLVLSISLPLTAQYPIPKLVKKNIQQVDPDSIKAHIAYLADDRMRGRLPGTPEYDLAVEYVESRFEKLGLDPAGENGTYRQRVKIRTARSNPDDCSLIVLDDDTEIRLDYGKDYVFQADLNSTGVQETAQTVYVRYGISAPELGYDDYRGVDAAGKAVIMLWGVPDDTFESSEYAHFSNIRTKLEIAFEQGAIGVLLLPPPSIGAHFARIAPRFAEKNEGLINMDGTVESLRSIADPGLRFLAFLNWTGLGVIMDAPEKTANELAAMLHSGEHNGFKRKVRVRSSSSHSDIVSYNVIGMLRGSHPGLKEEYVVHTAHLDHVGVGVPVEGDSIYNGAHDNASGTASCLEIARLYTSLKRKRPKRSILFMMVTAEEMGLLGSMFFANQPTVPGDKIVANVNTDMPTLIAPLLSVEPLGAEHSSLIEPVQEAADFLGLEVMEDHMPEEVRFVRSDQYSFILQGIPALHVKYGLKTSSPDFDLKSKIEDYTRNVYHKPSDELNDLFNFEAGRTYVQFNFLIGYLVSRNRERPQWNEDSFFGRFGNE